jgi:flagellar FliL protein
MSQAPAPAAPATGGTKKHTLFIAIVAVLVLGGGGGYYWWTQQSAAQTAGDGHHEEAEEKAPSSATRGLVSLDPFVVNLADPGVSRFLRVSLQLVVKSPEQARELEESKVALMQARSTILELLTTQVSDELVTAEGKARLRAAIIDKVGHAVEEIQVLDVLFSDFVVQF